MSRTRRNFSAKFKSELVIELLKGEKDLNTIASENNIQPNLLRNWKKEFLDKASVVFDDTREDNLKEKLALERKEKAEYAKKVGQLTMQVDWLKKKSEETLGPDYESKFSPKPFEGKNFQLKQGLRFLISCASVYYKGTPISQEVRLQIDQIPITHGYVTQGRQLSAQLKKRGASGWPPETNAVI